MRQEPAGSSVMEALPASVPHGEEGGLDPRSCIQEPCVCE